MHHARSAISVGRTGGVSSPMAERSRRGMVRAVSDSDNPGFSKSAEVAFEAMGPVYDDFTAHHDYELWLGSLIPELEANGLTGKKLLDVACGTGKSFIPLLERGWEVTACDISSEMLQLARTKAGERATLVVSDMRDLPKFGEFDLVLCLDDAINYLLEPEELTRALAGMRQNLAATGLLLFDANTIQPYRTFFAEDVVVEKGGIRLLWRGRSTPEAQPGAIYEATFEVELLEGGSELSVEPEVHRQRHFSFPEIQAALNHAGLNCLDVFGHDHRAIPDRPLDEAKHTKAIYIAGRR